MIRPILTHPDPVLRERSAPIGAVTAETRALLDDMLETMYAASGRGLAAPQIGVLSRAVVIDIAWKDGAPKPLVFVDPVILWSSEERTSREERCLSIPDAPRTVERPARVRVGYRDRDGGEREQEMSGLLAMVIQHEVDHLDGVLILDRAARLASNSAGARR